MKKTCKKLLFFLILFALIILIYPTYVNAVLQSNGGAVATKTVNDWIVQIRQMEAAGGTLGLSETINTTGLLATSPSNNLDCHMEKNTEYGALIILSASSYGKPTAIGDGETTTGNATGVKMNINKEWVAAGTGSSTPANFRNANVRYKNDDYGTSAGARYHTGDAMNIGSWHSSGATTWCTRDANNGCGQLLRAYSGSVFSYYGDGWYPYSDANHTKSWASRAVVVVGTDL